jgi:hypothetical protein
MWLSVFLQIVQHAMPMQRVILSSVVCLSGPDFYTLSHNRQDFQKKNVWIHNVFLDFIYNFYPKRLPYEELSEMLS